jgi:hypothetical protein
MCREANLASCDVTWLMKSRSQYHWADKTEPSNSTANNRCG